MQMLQAAWRKFRERFRTSILFKAGILTMPAGIALAVIAILVGLDQRILSNPQYWGWLMLAVAYISVVVGTTLWGWFSDPFSDPADAPE